MGFASKIYEGNHSNDIWLMALKDVMKQDEQPGRDQPTRELLHAQFLLHNSRNRYIWLRRINPAFALAEVIWIMAGSDDLEQIAWWNPRMRTWSDDGVRMEGAYGARLRKRNLPNLYHIDLPMNEHLLHRDQLQHAVDAFRDNPDRRDVLLQIWNASYDLPWGPEPRAKDIPCNIVAMPLIRDGKLEWQQVMRSNDIVWGLPYNLVQWTTIQEIMAGWLGVEVGSYSHLSNSLHTYQRHWEHAQEILDDEENMVGRPWAPSYDDLRLPWDESWKVLNEFKEIAFTLLPAARSTSSVMKLFENAGSRYPEGYRNIMRVLAAETLRKLDLDAQAHNMAESVTCVPLRVCMKRWLNHKRSS